MNFHDLDPVIRKTAAARMLGICRTSLWRLEKQGKLQKINVGARSAGYRLSALNAYIESGAR
jgi:predicted DNA-binding transcriptional regulator AlpA